MTSDGKNYAIAIDMLLSRSGSLKELASVSYFDQFSFYQGADLTNLDLSGQDLTGLNFDYADLSGSRLDRVRYDPGAFNRAKIDKTYASLSDPYDLTFDDLLRDDVGALALAFQFRPGILEELMSSRGMSVRDFAEAASLAPGTYWRMRNAHFVTYRTARKFIGFVKADEKMFIHSEEELSLLRQPNICASEAGAGQISSERVLGAADLLRTSWRIDPRPLHDRHNRQKVSVSIVEFQYLIDTNQVDIKFPRKGV